MPVAEHAEAVEQVAERIENIGDVAELRTAVSGDACMPEAVVPGPLIGDRSKISKASEASLKRPTASSSPGLRSGWLAMASLLVGLLDQIGTGVPLDAEHFVIVPFGSHRNHISGDLGRSRNRTLNQRGTNGPPSPVAHSNWPRNCTHAASRGRETAFVP